MFGKTDISDGLTGSGAVGGLHPTSLRVIEFIRKWEDLFPTGKSSQHEWFLLELLTT